MSYAEREQRAWQATQQALPQFAFDEVRRKQFDKFIDVKINEAKRDADIDRTLSFFSRGYLRAKEPAGVSPHSDAEIANLRKGSGAPREGVIDGDLNVIRKGAAQLREHVARERLERLDPVRDPRTDVWGLAKRLCEQPSSGKQTEIDSLMDALIAFCRQDGCVMAGDDSCPGLLQSAMVSEAKKGQRIALDLLERQGPVEWIHPLQPRAPLAPQILDVDSDSARRLAEAACGSDARISQAAVDELSGKGGVPKAVEIVVAFG